MITPWGKSHGKTKYRCGVTFFDTPSHGGYLVPATIADRFIPLKVRHRAAIAWRIGDWYEEDLAYAVVHLTIPGLVEEVSVEQVTGGWMPEGEAKSPEELRRTAAEVVVAWYGPEFAKALNLDLTKFTKEVEIWEQRNQGASCQL